MASSYGRFVGTLVGTAVFAASLLTPLSHGVPDRMAEATTPAEQRASVRDLFYDNSAEKLRDAHQYERAVAALPDGVGHLVVLGSSEFSGPMEQNANRLLRQHVKDFDFYESGRGASGLLQHATELAALAPLMKQKKVVLLVSPQWFTPDDLRPPFTDSFSDQYWDAVRTSPALSKQTRYRLTERVKKVRGQKALEEDTYLGPLGRQLRLYKTRSAAGQATAKYSEPYRVAPGSTSYKDLDWDAMDAKAIEQGRREITSNPYGIADVIFNVHQKPRLARLKNSARKLDYATAAERWGDLQLFLDVAKDNGVKVKLVSLPMNGRWYDHLGYDKARRAKYYAKLAQVARLNGADLTELQDREYEPYFFYDGTHPGWRGWLHVTRACLDFADA